MRSSYNSLHFHAKIVLVPSVGIVKDLEVVEILNNFVILCQQTIFLLSPFINSFVNSSISRYIILVDIFLVPFLIFIIDQHFFTKFIDRFLFFLQTFFF